MIIPILILVIPAAIFTYVSFYGNSPRFLSIIGQLKRYVRELFRGNKKITSSAGLDSRVRITSDERGGEYFLLDIRGVVTARNPADSIVMKLEITDITDSADNGQIVYDSRGKSNTEESRPFCYTANLGNPGHKQHRLTDWTQVARIDRKWLRLPRKGDRIMDFNLSLVSQQGTENLGFARCEIEYDNPVYGYIDAEENLERVKPIGVSLAFAAAP